MQILEILTPLTFLFAFIGLVNANGAAQAEAINVAQAEATDVAHLNDAIHHDNHGADSITASPAAPTAAPEILARASSIPVTVNPQLVFEHIAPTVPQAMCDTDNNNYENLTGTRGDGDGLVYDCQTLSGWLRNAANYGRFIVGSWNWDQTSEHYVDFLWTDHCAFGGFRTDFQQETLYVGAYDIADVIDVSVRHFSSPNVDPPKVEADGFMYCQTDIPFGWGLYNKFANEQQQWDDD
ncbi:hypothetical protein PG984_015304 [Apiospora sp. TS-2023a]